MSNFARGTCLPFRISLDAELNSLGSNVFGTRQRLVILRESLAVLGWRSSLQKPVLGSHAWSKSCTKFSQPTQIGIPPTGIIGPIRSYQTPDRFGSIQSSVTPV